MTFNRVVLVVMLPLKPANPHLRVGGRGIMKQKTIKILEMIAADMKNDAEKFDGQAFTGRTVAEYNGNQGAAIAALANIIKSMLEDKS